MKHLIPLLLACSPILLTAQGLIINEVSNGVSGVGGGAQEYIELVVIGSASNPTANVDLTGWIIDDNGGNFEAVGSGVGIANGHLRFTGSCFSSVRPGTIILLYNDADRNALIPADDVNDADADCVFIIASNSSCLERCTSFPSTSNGNYGPCTYTSPSYSVISLRNGGDVAQVFDPSFNFFHGFSYGDVGAPFPTFPSGASSFNVSTSSGTSASYAFSSGSFTNAGNFSRRTNPDNESPAQPNDDANRYFINAVRAGTFDYSNLSNPLNSGSSATLNNCLSILELNLLEFEVEKEGDVAKLRWVINQVAEQVFSFELERSTDGIHFDRIGSLEGNVDINYYSFVDAYPASDNYYRLKLTDTKGEVQYSDIRHLQFNNFSGALRIFPNPLSASRILTIETIGQIENVLIYNVLGQLLLEHRNIENTISLPTEWAAGIYTISLQIEGNQIVRKIIVE